MLETPSRSGQSNAVKRRAGNGSRHAILRRPEQVPPAHVVSPRRRHHDHRRQSGRSDGAMVLRLGRRAVVARARFDRPAFRITLHERRAARLRCGHAVQRLLRPRRPARPATVLYGVRPRRRGGECGNPACRARLAHRCAAAIHNRHLHGWDLSGRHETGDHLGQGRHGPDGRPTGRRIDLGLSLAAPIQRGWWCRLAIDAACRIVVGIGRGTSDPPRAGRPQYRAVTALQSAPCFKGLDHAVAAPRQYRLSRPYVGTLRHVGLDRGVPGRQLPADLRRCQQCLDMGGRRDLRDDRRRRGRVHPGRRVRRPLGPNNLDHRRHERSVAVAHW